MIGNCALYDIETDLKLSHIIPKFAFDYLKKTGGKYLRTFENPDQRVQDGPKEYLLSERAEQDFSKRERWFSNHVFLPYLKEGKTSFYYDENFGYFTVSVLWRVLLDQTNHHSVKAEPRLDFLNDVKEEWKLFLRDSKFPYNFNDLNIFLTDRVSSHNTNGINVDLYMSRTIDATIIHNEDYSTVAVYVKFLRFMIWSVVKGNPNDCEDIKIKFTSGNLKTPQNLRDDFFGGFLLNRIQEIDNKPKANKIQQQKIMNEVIKGEQDFWLTDAGKAMVSDYKNSKASH
ncbi:hypothetical protein FNO01nite_29510 [Flavobacterium noncentrifugens]|uniref:Uncharacterized protein n=1 Tax=Flavobacterium noncentrifugens TaxID=1128970 RepID=A0A1G8Y460_9FLAO|nr:hypothetical protein [Flavobacterium noncentrifugens]GEP52279.1 hypothetical protein FNO01nite_29510 [Flavobacterium noncentrifugens]SDJ96830.1 hypothetical protein SAMN04487935_2160 [Flavobacterium noncentrifugens]